MTLPNHGVMPRPSFMRGRSPGLAVRLFQQVLQCWLTLLLFRLISTVFLLASLFVRVTGSLFRHS